ncbi:P2X purinoceptor 7-like [Xenia sp. Carnegie-2017]|uniref:P2X purinoceptor 7-like n=1 Tax=Xenia sp. Carnegie-2017 TaxID=2897299 RepID=UPI001F0418A2|nr:P2X purinoceptor 7-like [Xenia sp. Carnegie-2017]
MFELLANAQGGQNEDNSSSSESEDEYIHRIGNVEWCECGFCVVMSKGRESICCQEVNNTDPLIHGDHICITQEEEFATVCTNEAVVKTAMVVYTHDIEPMPEKEENDITQHGVPTVDGLGAWQVGEKYRLPIPSCAVDKIRKAFPSPSGEYKGFEYAQHY